MFGSRTKSTLIALASAALTLGVFTSSAFAQAAPAAANLGNAPAAATVGNAPAAGNVGTAPAAGNVGTATAAANVGTTTAAANVGTAPAAALNGQTAATVTSPSSLPTAPAASLPSAPAASISGPGVSVQLGGAGGNATALQFFLLLTVLSLVPAILMMVTSFVRITIVLSFVRNAIGANQMPPNQVLLGLALFLSLFVMAPTWQRINTDALQPYLANQIPTDQAFDKASQPLRDFMFKQVRERDLALFIQVGNLPQPQTQADVPTYVLVPAFMISELKTAFQMGFMVMVPFLVIDIVVSSVLMSMGMMMLPPASISLPFKLLLFVMADGWHLIVHSLITSFA